jgi:Nif-specific regulatory protein
VIERAVVLADVGTTIGRDGLILETAERDSDAPDVLMHLPFHESVDHFKRLRLQVAIAKAGGNKTKAAHVLQLQPTYLSRLCKQMGVQ